MTQTARETMQAFLDGKTLRYDLHGMDIRCKLDDKGNLLQICDGGPRVLESWLFNNIKGIVEENLLTFEQALRAMLDGKTVQCEDTEGYEYRFNPRDSCFEYSFDEDWHDGCVGLSEQKSMWKVVE